MIGIYKITNKINNKSYIGQSVHIERRFKEHCMPYKQSYISRAIQKYGKNNFEFSIIEECKIEELNDKEYYWIQYYNTITPNGYNIIEKKSEEEYNNYYFYNKEQLYQIINDLKNTNLSFIEIGKKYNLNKSTISRINQGYIHKQSELFYPIRKTNYKNINKCIDCGKIISNKATRCIECYNKKRKIENFPSREQLKKMIRTLSFVQIGKKFKVSDNAVRKWCDKYNLPRKKSEINQYNDQEWQKI